MSTVGEFWGFKIPFSIVYLHKILSLRKIEEDRREPIDKPWEKEKILFLNFQTSGVG